MKMPPNNRPHLRIPLETTKILFDLKNMKIGCVLLQAAMGGDPGVAKAIDPKHWTTEPSEHLKLYSVNPTQIRMLMGKLEDAR